MRNNYDYPQPQPQQQRRAGLGRFFIMAFLLFLVVAAAATYGVTTRLSTETLAMLTGNVTAFTGLMLIAVLAGLTTIAVTRNSRDRWNDRDQRDRREALPAQPPVIVISPGGQISPYSNPAPQGYFSHTNKPREWETETFGGETND